MVLRLRPLRLHFVAGSPITFPDGLASNVLRGGMGKLLKQIPGAYERLFEPRSGGVGPSGFADQPRPFVLRASHLDCASIPAGRPFHFDLHLFDPHESTAELLLEVFTRLACDGFGPAQGSARLLPPDNLPPLLSLDLFPPGPSPQNVRVYFETPTEIKGAPAHQPPPFALLIARLRDRISNLRALYGEGPLEIDFREIARQAEAVRMDTAQLHTVQAARFTRRSSQVHSLGGYVGHADYSGHLTPFWGLLEAGFWTGIGRQTVWGKGQLRAVHERMPT